MAVAAIEDACGVTPRGIPGTQLSNYKEINVGITNPCRRRICRLCLHLPITHDLYGIPGSPHHKRMGRRLLVGFDRYRCWIARDGAPVSLCHFDYYGDGIPRDIGWQC